MGETRASNYERLQERERGEKRNKRNVKKDRLVEGSEDKYNIRGKGVMEEKQWGNVEKKKRCYT